MPGPCPQSLHPGPWERRLSYVKGEGLNQRARGLLAGKPFPRRALVPQGRPRWGTHGCRFSS